MPIRLVVSDMFQKMKKNKSQHEKLMDIAKAVEALGIGKDKGLMEQIRDEQNKPKPEVNLAEELSKPPRKKNNMVLYGGLEFFKKLCEKKPKLFGGFKY
jgi:hypothetical protein